MKCNECKKEVEDKVAGYSINKYKECLCIGCQNVRQFNNKSSRREIVFEPNDLLKGLQMKSLIVGFIIGFIIKMVIG